MNRIDRIFKDLRSADRRAIMPFLTAGDPDLATTAALIRAFASAGASICEVGIPFSDPIADGPVIQASMTYALQRGTPVAGVFQTVASVRAEVDIGLVAMVSYSIVHRFGLGRFITEAKSAGFDGFIFPDLSLEESKPAQLAVREAGMILSMLISPTTPIERARAIARASSGFVYVLSLAGTTGERRTLPADLPQRLCQLREATDLPIAVGFGISNPEQVGQVVSVADAAIVGSAVVRRVAGLRGRDGKTVAETVGGFVGELAGGLLTGDSRAGSPRGGPAEVR